MSRDLASKSGRNGPFGPDFIKVTQGDPLGARPDSDSVVRPDNKFETDFMLIV
jgi:hypothetical protein